MKEKDLWQAAISVTMRGDNFLLERRTDVKMTYSKTRFRATMAAVAVCAFALSTQVAQAANFKITSAVMAKKYSGGKTSGVTNTFKPSDHTIYCVLRTDRILKNIKARFVWTAVNAKGIRANEKFLDKTGNLKAADIIWGSAALPKAWPTGSYKVDVYINGAKIKTLSYSIR
jgi:hypothetical protein